MKKQEKNQQLKAHPGQSGYVQSVLVEHPALHYLLMRDIQRVKLYRHQVEYSPFAERVAAALIAEGIDPRKSKKIILTKAVSILRPQTVERIRVIHLEKSDGSARYLEYLKSRLAKQDSIIFRAMRQKRVLKAKIKKLSK
jgi:hypothetical protein